MPLDGQVLVDWGGVSDAVACGGLLLEEDGLAAEGVGLHVSGEHYLLGWWRA